MAGIFHQVAREQTVGRKGRGQSMGVPIRRAEMRF